MKSKKKPGPRTAPYPVSRVEGLLRYGAAEPLPDDSYRRDEETAAEFREAAAKLSMAAARFEASAALKRQMSRFGMGPESWRT